MASFPRPGEFRVVHYGGLQTLIEVVRVVSPERFYGLSSSVQWMEVKRVLSSAHDYGISTFSINLNDAHDLNRVGEALNEMEVIAWSSR